MYPARRDLLMTQTEIAQLPKTYTARPHLWAWLAAVAALAAYAPTFLQLAEGPWQTEQEGHGPLIIAACLWLVWSSRVKLRSVEIRPRPIAGWASLLLGLAIALRVAHTGPYFHRSTVGVTSYRRMHPHFGRLAGFANTGFSDRIFDFHSACTRLDG